jgi:hypothetical protein
MGLCVMRTVPGCQAGVVATGEMQQESGKPLQGDFKCPLQCHFIVFVGRFFAGKPFLSNELKVFDGESCDFCAENCCVAPFH